MNTVLTVACVTLAALTPVFIALLSGLNTYTTTRKGNIYD